MSTPSEPEPAPEQLSQDIVVFRVRGDSWCDECGRDLSKGGLLRLDRQKPLCLDCADLGHLEYLPRGDAAVTRRATRYSGLHAVVVEWSRSRKRYERQGILAEPSAIRRAEQESLADAELRACHRKQADRRRELEDRQFIDAFAGAIRTQYPGCPAEEAAAIATHACLKHSGRVGRSAAAKAFDPSAIRLAVIARIRHMHTGYDKMLMRTGDRQLARAAVQPQIDLILLRWEQGRVGG